MIIELLDSRVLLAYSPIGPEVGAIDFGSSIADYQGGGFITVGQESNGATLDVFIRRYEANGTFVSRTRANLDTNATQIFPRATVLSNGNLVVAWAEYSVTSNYRTEMRLFRPDLTPLSSDIGVSELWPGTSPIWTYYPRVASMPNGEFAVAWCDANLLAHVQVYHSDGQLKSGQVLSNTAHGNKLYALDADSAGNLFVVWGGGDPTPYAIRTDPAGAPVIDPVTVPISSGEWNLSGGMDDSGRFVVTANDAMRRYNADGTPSGVPISLGTTASVRESVVEPDGTHLFALTLVQPSYQKTELRVYAPDDTLQQRMLIDNGFNYSRRVVAVDVMADSSIRIISSRSYSGSQATYYARHYSRFDTQTRGQIGDRVWEDTNGDGIQTASEQNMSGVTLTLFNEFGLHIADVVSSAAGYLFDYVMPEQQIYVAVTRGTLVHSPRAATLDGTVDSDADPSTGRTELLSLSSGENRTSVDFGLFRSSTIRGTAYNDRNANGIKDPGEPSVHDITLYLDNNSNGEFDPDEPGDVNLYETSSGYRISSLPAGTFKLAVLPRIGWTTPAEKAITLGTGVITTVDVPVRTHTGPGLLTPKLAATPVLPTNSDTYTALEVARNGDAVVAWNTSAGFGSARLLVRAYNADGTPKSDSVDVGAARLQRRPDLVVLSDGKFVVAWEGSDGKPYLRLFSPAAVPLTAGVIATDPPTLSLGGFLTVIADVNDHVTAIWTASVDGRTTLRRFAPDLTPLTSAIAISRPKGITALAQPEAAGLPNGGMVICWIASGQSSDSDVHGQWLDSKLVALGPIQLLAQTTTGLHREVRVVADDAGIVTVMWSGPNGTGFSGVQARRYTQSGEPLGTETSDYSQALLEGVSANSRGDVVQLNKDSNQFNVSLTSTTGEREGVYSLLPANMRAGLGGSIAITDQRVVWVAYPQTLSGTLNGVFLRSFVWSPRLYEAKFTVDAAAPALRYIFNENVSASLTSDSIAILDRSTNAPVSAAVELSYDPSLNRAEFRLPELPDGNYRATLAASAVTDDVGNPLTVSNDLEFFVFAGDANRDRAVNIRDFALFAPRYGLAGTFSEGDFNYSGFVDVADFSLLAANFNEVLPAPAPLSSRAWQRPPFRSSNDVIGLRSDRELLFELVGEVDQPIKTVIGGSFQRQI